MGRRGEVGGGSYVRLRSTPRGSELVPRDRWAAGTSAGHAHLPRAGRSRPPAGARGRDRGREARSRAEGGQAPGDSGLRSEHQGAAPPARISSPGHRVGSRPASLHRQRPEGAGGPQPGPRLRSWGLVARLASPPRKPGDQPSAARASEFPELASLAHVTPRCPRQAPRTPQTCEPEAGACGLTQHGASGMLRGEHLSRRAAGRPGGSHEERAAAVPAP